MRTELFVLLFTSACSSTLLRSDLARIEEITARDLGEDILGDPLDHDAIVPEHPLAPDDAVRIALANNRELRATLRELGVERGRLVQSRLLPNPEVEIDLRRQRDRTQPLQVELFAAFELTEALLTPLRAAVARSELDAARLRVAGHVIETEYEVRAAFYDAQAAEQRLALAIRSLDAMAASRDSAQMLFDAGNIPEVDLAIQIAAYEEARAATAEIELERASTRERLHRLLGLHGHATHWTIAGALPAASPPELPEELERAAIEASVELRELRSRLEALGRRAGLSRAEGWIPDVAVDVHGEQDGNTWELGGGASVRIPLFDQNSGTTAALQAQISAMLERYEGVAIDLRSAARDARNHLTSSALRARQYTDVIVPARQRALEQTLLQYNAMQTSVFALVSALRAKLGAELEAVEALRAHWTARAAMDALLRGRRVGEAPMHGRVEMSVGDDATGGH